MTVSLKDYAFLDTERIRSYLAQLDGGLVDSATKATLQSANTSAGVKSSGLAKLVADAEASGGYAYQRTNSETSSLHHAVFDILHNKLKAGKMVSENTASDDLKPFIEVTANLRVLNYKLLAEQLQSMTTLAPLIDKISNLPEKTLNREAQGTMKDVAKIILLLYGDLQTLQLIDAEGLVIAQIIVSDELNLPKSSLLTSSSNEVLAGKWTIFGLKVPHTTVSAQQATNNELGAALAKTSSSIDEFKKLIFDYQNLPTISPIAIYRQL